MNNETCVDLIELKMAVTLEHEVVIKLTNGDLMSGTPKWTKKSNEVQLRTVDGAVKVDLEEIQHVTRIIPFKA
ncbi:MULTISPECIES: hypothetical protein [Paenibacillus]|uniref:hypothetical protein n=1 Tax=Paenibacillus TaxID=44249 RepID=UPI0008391964|nr:MULTISPECIES: hypothetical protein [Paenibacillus]GIP20386.1 hypothetical protein J22TS3_06610 [Paenibacillus sp. J22TS3]